MPKIIFVCYDQGSGGERMSVEISKLSNVYDLKYKLVGSRTVTQDITLGYSRNDLFKLQTLQNIFEKLDNNKWYVVPTHFKPKQLEKLNIKKFYVIIYISSKKSLTEVFENKKEKVWNHTFTDALEIKGQIEAHKADPYDPYIISRLKGPISYGKLWSIIKKIEPLSKNLKKEFDLWVIEGIKGFNKYSQKIVNLPNSVCIEYQETRHPDFYQNFTKTLSKHLTKLQ